MTDTRENNKRIAKNTGLLYIRMFIIMAVSLFTSRVVLRALGVEDFGIYNVVGGIVVMMGVFNQALSSSVQRYLSFEIGQNNDKRLHKVFCVSINLYAVISVIFIILAETIGLWLLNYKLIIPPDRLFAANVVFQFSILATIATLMTNVFNAVIISHERMNFYAYVSIVEVALKLAIAYLITLGSDKLILYGILTFAVAVVIGLCYMIYCNHNFAETRYKFVRDKKLFWELFAFSGWNIFGIVSGIAKTQGLNVLLNMFFNPAVNAARGIAVQISSAVGQFFNNFFIAVKPQITKYYAQGDIENLMKLVSRSSKFSFYLILLISMPIMIDTPYIINLWLGELPDYVVPFTRLIILITAVDAMANSLMTAAQATGHIRLYQVTVGTMIILNLPISYIFLKLGFDPSTVFIISLIISIICLFMRVWIVKRLIPEFREWKYIYDAIIVSFVAGIIASIIPVIYRLLIPVTFLHFVILVCISITSTLMSCIIVGMSRGERAFVLDIVRQKILKRFKK